MVHHLTHFDNLNNIIKQGLLARNFIPEFKDIANPDIIIKRNNLNDYVPLHFNSLQEKYGISYNHAICNNYKKENLIYLVFNILLLYGKFENILYFVYHPVSDFKIECHELLEMNIKLNEEFNKLPKKYAKRPNYNSHRVQEYFMSEILIKEKIDFSLVSKIIVYSDEAKEKVKEILNKTKFNTTIEIDKNFFK